MEQNKLYYQDNYLNYIKQNSRSNKQNICIVFFCGLMSNVDSTKARFIAEFCENQDIEYIRFDYYGHGKSSGDFASGTISIWLENCLNVMQSLTNKNLVIVGSSMGAWLMFLAALRVPDRIKALIGLAPAVDFTENLVWGNLSDDQKIEIETKGKVYIGNDYCDHQYLFTYNLIKDGRQYLLLDSEIETAMELPIVLIHGMEDKDVPYMHSIRLAEKLKSSQVKIELIKDATHNLNREKDLSIIRQNLKNILELINI